MAAIRSGANDRFPSWVYSGRPFTPAPPGIGDRQGRLRGALE
jgi:hypothetical protein